MSALLQKEKTKQKQYVGHCGDDCMYLKQINGLLESKKFTLEICYSLENGRQSVQ